MKRRFSGGGSVARYAYDTLRRRIAKTVNGSATAYVDDIGNLRDATAHNVLSEYQGGTLTRRWLHGQEIDEPVAFEDDAGSTTRGADDETGLIYYRTCHYNPEVGRFVQSDPLGFAAGDLNFYAYTVTDPSGLMSSREASSVTSAHPMFVAGQG
jgi:RHS repeat-associated protein